MGRQLVALSPGSLEAIASLFPQQAYSRGFGCVNVCAPPLRRATSSWLECCVGAPVTSQQFGKVVLTTTFGIMDHEEARRKHTGGKVLGFFY